MPVGRLADGHIKWHEWTKICLENRPVVCRRHRPINNICACNHHITRTISCEAAHASIANGLCWPYIFILYVSYFFFNIGTNKTCCGFGRNALHYYFGFMNSSSRLWINEKPRLQWILSANGIFLSAQITMNEYVNNICEVEEMACHNWFIHICSTDVCAPNSEKKRVPSRARHKIGIERKNNAIHP